jgi:hypothetical protein
MADYAVLEDHGKTFRLIASWCNITDENGRERYLVDRWASLRRADLEETIECFIIEPWFANNDFPITPAVVSAIGDVFRHYRRRGHMWGELRLICGVANNHYLRSIVAEAKSVGIFTAIEITWYEGGTEDEYARLVREAVLMNPRLQKLRLHRDDALSLETHQIISDCLQTIPLLGVSNATRLTDLTLEYFECRPDDDLRLLTEGMNQNDCLKVLRLHSQWGVITPTAEANFTDLVNALPNTLEVLDLRYYLVNPPVQNALMRRLTKSGCRIREMRLGAARFARHHGVAVLDTPSLTEALKRNNSLVRLEFEHYKFTSEDILSLLNALPYCPKLQELHLEYAAIPELDFTLESISPSSTLKTLNLAGFNCDKTRVSTPEFLARSQRSRKSMVAMLKAIPSLGSLPLLLLFPFGRQIYDYENFLHSPEIQFLLDFNRITRGKMADGFQASVPPCLWVQVLRKVDKILGSSSQQNENKLLRCKASVLFCLLRNSPEVVLALRDEDAGNEGLVRKKRRKS